MLPRHLAPPAPEATARLGTLVAAATAARLRRFDRALGRHRPARGTILHRLRSQVRAAVSLLGAVPRALRTTALTGPDLRGFLAEGETWLTVVRLAESAANAALFDRISRTEHLATLLPRGRIDAGFPARARRFALARLDGLPGELGATLLGLRLAAGPSSRPLEVTLVARASAEQGRPATRIDLGTLAGPAGPLGLRARPGAVCRVRLERGLLRIAFPGEASRYIPAAATLLAFPSPLLAVRRRIPGSPILLAPALRSTPRHLGVGRDVPGLDARLGRALRLVRLAWPEAHRDLLGRTAMVVPVREPRLVSYSLADRPGISFLNVHAKPTLVLADDLVHENAHHLLHDVEAVARLVAAGPETEEVQAFDSPWRRERRPLRGILHGTFTFLFRAELFARLLSARADRPRLFDPLLGPGGAAFLRRELRREVGLIGRGLDEMTRGGATRLLTPEGRALLRSLVAWHHRVRRLSRRLARRGPVRYDARAPKPGPRRRP